MLLAPGPPLEVREVSPKKGRGVFSVTALAARTLIHVSPVLLFPHAEYESHGKFTLLDHYTYRWPGGMALALGLGSIFNHSRRPNVGFIRDVNESTIRYLTLRDVQPGEELCISYGKRLWFEDVNDEDEAAAADGGEGNEMSEDSKQHEIETAEGFFEGLSGLVDQLIEEE